MGLLAPWFLGGLAALGVPVFVHLLRRHVAVPRPVGSLMFFERGTQSSRRHRRLKHLLLFALRAALLLLVVLAFANPFVRRPAAAAGGRQLLIVLDNSFSMRAGTRFADAKRDAVALLAARPAGQRAQVIALGGQVQVLTQPETDAVQLRTALESIQQGDGRGSFGELGRVVRALHEGSPGAADLHLFSDVQRSAAPANFADMVLPEETTLTIHAAAGSTDVPNWTVVSVDAPAKLSDPRDTTHSRVLATVAGFHTPPVTKTVSLVVNGTVRATRRVDIPANGHATVEFAPLDVAYGFNRCEVRVDAGDGFPQDDVSRFAVQRSDPERVLFVRADGDTRSDLYFRAALQAAAQGSFTLQTVAPGETNSIDPSRFAFIVLGDAVSLPPVVERNLRDYVVRGGSVLVALGTGAANHPAIPLWGGAVRDVHAYTHNGGGAAAVGQVDFSHPAFADAEPGRDNGGWAGVTVLYAAVVDPANARVAARLSDGTPLLLDRTLGEGHLLLFTTGFDSLTNDLPLHPVFVAFVDHVSRYLSGIDRLSGSRRVGSYLQLRAAGAAAVNAGGVEVVGPDGQRPLSLGESRTAQGIRLDQTGFYQVRFASGRDAVIGVNPDQQESDLQPMPADMQALWAGSGASTSNSTALTANAAARHAGTRPVSLWWYVMLLALLVAVAETVLASGYMGTQREDA